MALAYLVAVVVRFPAMVRALYWDSDAAGAFVLGELAPGHGTVQIPRFGFWTSLWWLMATRGLPGHRHLWEVTGYAFALATVALVCWATWRVAGRWAGVTAAATTVIVGPRALRSLLTVNFHTSTPFTVAVLAAYLVILTRRRSWLLAGAVGVLAGANAASDPLLWIAGIAPFVLGAAVLTLATRRPDVAWRAAVVLAVIGVSVVAIDRVMSGLHFHLIPVGVQLAGAADLVPNFIKLGKSIALVFGANHFFPGVYPSTPLRYLITFLAFAGVAATLVAAVRFTVRRGEPALRAYACYWATAAVLLGLGYWTTNQGTGVGPGGGVNYVLPFAPVAGVGVGLLAAGSISGRIIVSLAIAAVATINIVGIAHARAEEPAAAQEFGPQLIRLIESQGMTHGYAGYWDAQSLTWKSGLRLLVVPVQACPDALDELCRFPFFTIGSWYHQRSGGSFLIVDPAAGLAFRPPASFGDPLATYALPRGIVVYTYPYDLAHGHIR
jgi:hypothetical protein